MSESQQNTAIAEAKSRTETESKAWWRAVLGEYPTGVTAITSTAPDGTPIGMVVGTFMAVSESPALVGFLPTVGSWSFEAIRKNGTFCANVLGFEHEAVCRKLASRAEDRFGDAAWGISDHGNPRLHGAVSWFEAKITQVTEVGDHYFVVAEVVDFGIGDGQSGLPLLFLKGGYGSFTVPSLDFDVPGLSGQLRAVEGARKMVEALSEETQTECVLSSLVDDSVVVLCAANLLPNRPRYGLVGMNFPFSAPLSPVLAAWGDLKRTKMWEEHSRHLLGRVDRELIGRLLTEVKKNGYALTAGVAASELDEVANSLFPSRSDFAGVLQRTKENIEHALAFESALGAVDEPLAASVQFPVFDEKGHARFELVLSGIDDYLKPGAFSELVARAKRAAAELTVLNGGIVPADYPA